VELILDSSGSMKEEVEGTPKNRIARRMMDQVLGDLPNQLKVGMRLFGHWGRFVRRMLEKDGTAGPVSWEDPRINKDSQLVVQIAPLNKAQRARIEKWLDWTAPRGKTPLVHSLLEARHDFPSDLRAGKTIVLVSDGKETCGGNLEDVAEAYRNSDIDVVIHVVGFDVEEDQEAKRQLMEFARIGGGVYFNARDARGLTSAVLDAVKRIEFVVLDPGSREPVARGAINGDPVVLDPGKYLVKLTGVPSDPSPVELTAGQQAEMTLDDDGNLQNPGNFAP
jgi:hypothetical protein